MDNSIGLIEELAGLAEKNNDVSPELYSKYEAKYNVKRGLRNIDGSGVVAGITGVGEVHGYKMDENDKVPDIGRLKYRGMDISELVTGFQGENRFGFEETCYLLLFGELATKEKLDEFNELLGQYRTLPEGFTENMIIKVPSRDIMNKLARCILVSYSYDSSPDDISVGNVVRQSVELIARMPTMMAYGFQAKRHYFNDESLFIHHPKKELSTAENILHMIRPNSSYTRKEAELLDLALVLHAEHGGGNNSTFTTRVVSSSGTDTYSAIAAAIGSLKGPKHGGANVKVVEMMKEIKANVDDWEDKSELENYLVKILNKDAFDKKGLIYGMGHAVYTLSDPRAVLLKLKALELAKEKGYVEEFNLYQNVEEVAPKVISRGKGEMSVPANVDLYSGFVYNMLEIPSELYTPLFAVSRVSGWCAHRLEQLITEKRIIRPAYKSLYINKESHYVPLEQRGLLGNDVLNSLKDRMSPTKEF